MDVRIRLGSNLRALRLAQGLSQEELASRADVHQTYLSDVELGKRNPSLLILDQLAVALRVDITDLLRRRD